MISYAEYSDYYIFSIEYLSFLYEKKIFPKFYIGLHVGYLLFSLMDHWVTIRLYLETSPEPQTSYFLKTTIGLLIWSTYLLTSKRVKATFIR
ncbi:MAG: DUF2569 domain-containing protein [Alphaproteobacteria bacterium]|nr:DUF2569 domain-containing protein [Alphaproteobacteria bacterium]NCQ66293.1 DUF2569 domain-containing protein [Alphaproteobacteria bacterium]NCT06779.1 DUF2569 domain-containing protein [Alphaproteobacteria bacterium]